MFRHRYSFELDWDRERTFARKFGLTTALLRKQVTAFLERLAEIGE